MRTAICISSSLALVLAGGLWQSAATLAQGNAVHAHIGHVMDKFQGAPMEQGLLPAALAEAKIAAQHAAYVVKDADSLDSMKRHAGHVVHAIDPTLEVKGPGLGYGLKKAASGVAMHIELAAKDAGASANVKTHSTHVAAAAKAAAARADEALALAKRIQAASTVAEAAPLATQLQALTEQVTAGVDANKDGRVGWDTPEGGLQQAQQHMEFMKKGEGL